MASGAPAAANGAQPEPRHIRIGVLALQGSFREHMASLRRLPNVEAVEVRTKEQLHSVDGLIIPGGESTTMANIAERWGLIPDLRSYCAQSRPVWGTCAGLIFLADRATGVKQGGQALLGGLDCLVARNFFGAQINSFETRMPAPPCLQQFSGNGTPAEPYRAVFIRAPGILECGSDLEVLSEYQLTPEEQQQAEGVKSVAVAVRRSNLLATAFHPELTDDVRWHQVFVDMVREQAPAGEATPREYPMQRLPSDSNRPRDIPVYDRDLSAQW